MASRAKLNYKSLFRKALVGVCLFGAVGTAAHGAFKAVASQCTANDSSNTFCQAVEGYNNSKTFPEAMGYELEGLRQIVRHGVAGYLAHGFGN